MNDLGESFRINNTGLCMQVPYGTGDGTEEGRQICCFCSISYVTPKSNGACVGYRKWRGTDVGQV
jgi:hypothetical protein